MHVCVCGARRCHKGPSGCNALYACVRGCKTASVVTGLTAQGKGHPGPRLHPTLRAHTHTHTHARTWNKGCGCGTQPTHSHSRKRNPLRAHAVDQAVRSPAALDRRARKRAAAGCLAPGGRRGQGKICRAAGEARSQHTRVLSARAQQHRPPQQRHHTSTCVSVNQATTPHQRACGACSSPACHTRIERQNGPKTSSRQARKCAPRAPVPAALCKTAHPLPAAVCCHKQASCPHQERALQHPSTSPAQPSRPTPPSHRALALSHLLSMR
jgi:hypothetical protein